ncbi:hypothetical protein PHET_07808 [Paragonimus heterotremus]|uniref:Uncharacterized protein n=1 Tax=Paragonimus heterotremus TaxID=100268 RepID=A0A8J4WV76_9TREM|nr:hypothetical protein PHET_07808 [Paragonimus heterotremus]
MIEDRDYEKGICFQNFSLLERQLKVGDLFEMFLVPEGFSGLRRVELLTRSMSIRLMEHNLILTKIY